MLNKQIDMVIVPKTILEVSFENRFPVICAWCNKPNGLSTIEGSTCICNNCFEKLMKNYLSIVETVKAI
ncbi:MAG: hypothetical protein HY819_04310 [Acidobacteria bacterium]|nr:hypothetical protein [Acidobacteriota bacterium]